MPAVLDPLLPDTTVIDVAAPAVSETGAVTAGSPGVEKLRVRAPTVPARLSPLNVARPFPSVVTVALVSVPPPEATATVTLVPATVTGFPNSSCTSTTGCTANGERLALVVLGLVTKAILLGAPAATVAVKLRGLFTKPALVAVTA